MARHHLRFRHFNRETVAATEELFAAKPWQLDDALQLAEGSNWLKSVSRIYDVPQPTLVILPINEPGVAVEDDTIYLARWSILSLFCGFRQHMLNHGHSATGDSDSDALAWGCSLFYRVKPAMFRARVREGCVYGVTARDTYTADSWRILEEAGVTLGDRMAVTGAEASAIIGAAGDSLDAEVELVDGPSGESLGTASTVSDAELADTNLTAALAAESRDRLRVLAAQAGVPGRGRMSKAELVVALANLGVQP